MKGTLMLGFCVLLLGPALCFSYRFSVPLRRTSWTAPRVRGLVPHERMQQTTQAETQTASSSTFAALLEPNDEDMRQYAFILANVTDHLDSKPESALSIASNEMGWLLQRNVPKLTEMLLQKHPEVRQDQGMMRGYMFLMDFLEAVSKETSTRIQHNQKLLKGLLEASKVSEAALDDYIATHADKLTSPDFKVYLEAEIENAESDSRAENLLVTVQLRLLDEEGKRMGVDVMVLPKLAALTDPAELRAKTTEHLLGYDAVGRRLFLHTLQIMLGEMTKRYERVDPLLLLNLREVLKIAQGFVDQSEGAASSNGD